ncbi:MAG: type II/IV secretion system ATPase subunit [Halorubrum sp.]
MDSESIDAASPPDDETRVALGEYTWKEFMREHEYGEQVETLYRDVDADGTWDTLVPFYGNGSRSVPGRDDWARVEFDPTPYLGCPPDAFEDRLRDAASAGAGFDRAFRKWIDDTPVTKDEYTWEHFKWEYYYEDGRLPRTPEGEPIPFEPEQYLGFDPDDIESVLAGGAEQAAEMLELEDRRTVNVNPDLDEDAFFSTAEGRTTLVNRYDLEKAVSMDKKRHFFEEERYWVDKPNALVVIFHSAKENEKKYYVIEPYLNDIETDLVEFFSEKLRTSIKYSDEDIVVQGTDEDRRQVLEDETKWLIDRHDLRDQPDDAASSERTFFEGLAALDVPTVLERLERMDPAGVLDGRHRTNGAEAAPDGSTSEDGEPGELAGISARPEPAVLEEDSGRLTEYQIEKLLHVIRRDFIGYERIDPIKHDINIEDISCDGYNSPVFVYHTDYENLITNVRHGEERLDNFVIKLAQRSGKGISKRQPQVDATLPDGSRAQLTLGKEVSDHGTNYTIRQFNDVPFTPVDLINWKTFSLDEMAFLWLCIESKKSLIFAGGTASGKTTSLNAVSLFIPSNSKIVSIEDTREVELPQRNWVASVTRPSFSQDNAGDVDEFDLLEAALRQRPDFIVMGEVRGEEGRTLFQVMSTGHTTYTTFHADTVDEVLKRFTTDPINVSKTLFTALDLVSVQTQTKVDGTKVRRNKTITEINSYDAENNEISVQDIYQWQPEDDEFRQHGNSKKLQEIAFDRGWSAAQLEEERFERRAVLSYLITNGLNTYTEVAATLQAYINDSETILTLIANGNLEESLKDLREMESVLIEVDSEKEALVPRPEPDADVLAEAEAVIEEAQSRVFEEYRGRQAGTVLDALSKTTREEDITASGDLDRQVLASVTDQSDIGVAGDPPTDGDPLTDDAPPIDGDPLTDDDPPTDGAPPTDGDTETAPPVDPSSEDTNGRGVDVNRPATDDGDEQEEQS